MENNVIPTCIYKGKLLEDCSCKNKDMQIYECAIIGKTINKCCGKDKCKKYSIGLRPQVIEKPQDI